MLNQTLLTIRVICFLGVIMLTLLACASKVEFTEPVSVHATINETVIEQVTVTTMTRILPKPTDNTDSTPTLVLSTPIPTETTLPIFTPTILPSPTLTHQQEVEIMANLMQTNEGCKLPCWWGIEPGQSHVEIIKNEFVPKGFAWWEGNELFNNIFLYAISVIFETEDNIIQFIRVHSTTQYNYSIQDWEKYRLEQILQQYGIPSRVQVYYPWRPDPYTPSSYRLFLFYEDLGIEIDYLGDAIDTGTERSRACPDSIETYEINLLLYQPGLTIDVLEVVMPVDTISYIGPTDIVYELTSWEQATGTSIESFYETFVNPKSQICFEFLTYWPSARSDSDN